MATLTNEEAKIFVEKMVATGNGDRGRLVHILNTLNSGRALYNSDQKYLDSKLAEEIGLVKKIKTDESLIDKVQRLVDSGSGDVGRLQFILESLQQGKTLYRSDKTYLEKKLGEPIHDDSKSDQKTQEKTSTTKPQVTVVLPKIVQTESQQHKSEQHKTEPAPTHKKPVWGTMPRDWSPPKQITEEITEQINIELANLEREKDKTEQIKIEQSKIMQIILDRKEFEQQLRIEQEKLQQQIELERKAVKEQAALMEQIKLQEEEIAKAKREYDAITSDLQTKQEKLSRRIAKEREKLAEQTAAAQKIQQEKEHLQEIQAERKSDEIRENERK
jgi:DNA repair exonuclease SbcCD ATPase subunit